MIKPQYLADAEAAYRTAHDAPEPDFDQMAETERALDDARADALADGYDWERFRGER